MNRPFLIKCIGYGAALLSLMLSGACTGDDKQGSGGLEGPVTIPTTIDTRSVEWDYEGDGIQTIRIIYWKNGAQALMSNQLYGPADFTQDGTAGNNIYGTKEFELFPGAYDFMVIANEKAYGPDLAAASTFADLERIITSKINLESGEAGGYPAGTIIPESTMVPFTRYCYMKGVQIGNNMSGDPVNIVSTDGGATWQSGLTFKMTRLASRINISIRKMTGVGTTDSDVRDRFSITALRLLRVPNYAYMIPSVFTDNVFNSLLWYEYNPDAGEENDFFELNNNGGVEDPTGKTTFTYDPYPGVGEKQIYVRSNRVNIVFPEYIMANNANWEAAVVLEVRGNYEQFDVDDVNGNGDDWLPTIEDVWTLIPLQTGGTVLNPTYDFLRNHDYHVMLTITKIANFSFVPHVTLAVSDWSTDGDAYINAGNANLSANGRWTAGAADGGGSLYVDENQYVEYTLSFSRSGGDPSPVNWKAVLSNPVDFELITTGGAATQGYTRPGDEVKIRVAPRAPFTQLQSTKIYINVDDGAGGVKKLPIEPTDKYTIYKTPQ